MLRSEKAKRTAPIYIRLTPDEKSELKTRSESMNTTVSDYIRNRCLGLPVPRRARTPNVDQQKLLLILSQLGKLQGNFGKIGSNMNQIAHVANMDKYLANSHELALADVQAAMADLIEMRAAIMEALGREI